MLVWVTGEGVVLARYCERASLTETRVPVVVDPHVIFAHAAEFFCLTACKVILVIHH